jgi:hypothetical protein
MTRAASHTMRFPRTYAEAFKGPDYGAAIERPIPRSIFASPSFWISVAIVTLWTVAWWVLTR